MTQKSGSTSEAIFESVADMIVDQLNIDKKEVHLDASFADLKADSLDVIEIVMQVEETYGISLTDEAVAKIKTVGQFVEHIKTLVS